MKKIRFSKEVAFSVLFSAIGALVITFIIQIISLFSWSVVCGIIGGLLIVPIHALIKLYNKSNCFDIADLLVELFDETEEEDNNDNNFIN